MGRNWDSDKGGRDNWIVWMSDIARECLRVLKPGGHAFVWALPRTSHWTGMAWENAGFEIREVVAHIFGSGFPKSLNIGKTVDKLRGNEREDLGLHPQPGKAGKTHTRDGGAFKENIHITKGTSEWEGWGTALKPSREDWILMRKPLSEKTVAENCLKWGTGGLNIDESRVGTEGGETHKGGFQKQYIGDKVDYKNHGVETDLAQRGRFPANLIHDNSPEVRECFPETKSVKSNRGNINIGKMAGGSGQTDGTDTIRGHNDSGNASRFFKSIIYTAKASKSERNMGCEGLEEKEGGSLEGGADTRNGKIKTNQPLRTNNHPCVKPIALMEYLIKMICPKGGIVLDPFCGSGSTGIAAKQNGFGFIGIEKEEEYVKIAEARISNIKVQPKLF